MAKVARILQDVIKNPHRVVHYGKAAKGRLTKETEGGVFTEEQPGGEGALVRARSDGSAAPLVVVDQETHQAVAAQGLPVVTLDRDAASATIPLLSPDHLVAADAVVVASSNRNEYANVLRFVHRHRRQVPVYTDRSGFEWVGSAIPLYSKAEHVIYLHNYFHEHFGLKDPIQVRVDAWNDGKRVHRQHRILGADETWIITDEDLGLASKSDAFVTVRCWHPVLTRGRHKRMRMAVDVLVEGATATLHSSHDFGAPHAVRGQLTVAPEANTVFTFPDYEGMAARTAMDLRIGRSDVERVAVEVHRNREVALDDAVGPGRVRYAYQGQANGFWFQHAAGRLAANHHVSTIFDALPPKPLDHKTRSRLAALEEQGLRFMPFALPIFPKKSGLTTSFSFENTLPHLTRLRAVWFDDTGAQVKETLNGVYEGKAWTSAVDLDAEMATQCADGLVLVSPDWSSMEVAPKDIRLNVDVAVQEIKGTDMDVTEFQPSWMNLDGYVKDHPRWMFPPGVNTARTSVLMRGVADTELDTELVVVCASGDLGFSGSGTMEFRFYRPDGQYLRAHRPIHAWRQHRLRLVDLFPGLHDFCPEGRGYVRLLSLDIDTVSYAVTRRKGGGVGLQHLWGY